MLIEKLEGSSASSNLGENVRVIPLPARKFENTIEQMERLWNATKNRNRLRVVRPGESAADGALQQKAIVSEPVRTSGREHSQFNGRSELNGKARFDARPERDASEGSAGEPQTQPGTGSKPGVEGKPAEEARASEEPKTTASLRFGHFVAIATHDSATQETSADGEAEAEAAAEEEQEENALPDGRPATGEGLWPERHEGARYQP